MQSSRAAEQKFQASGRQAPKRHQRPVSRGLWRAAVRYCCGAVLVLQAACGEPPPQPFGAEDITGASFGGDIHLTDHRGAARSLADFRGSAVLVFFGYTHCPDICPTTMSRFADVRRMLGADGANLKVVFVTLDPERDTVPVLEKYVPFFDPDFVGLTGSVEAVADVAKRYRVPYVRRQAEDGSYLLDHWAGAYAFDAGGRLRLYVPPDLSNEALAADLRRLIASK